MEIVVNGEWRDTSDGQTVAGLLNELDLPRRGLAVLVADELVPAARYDRIQLREGDVVEIVTMVGGG